MKKWLLAATASLALVACGGGGSASVVDDQQKVAFAGTYAGTYKTYDTSDTQEVGTFNVSVSDTGAITGTAKSTTFNESYNVTGKANTDGKTTLDASGKSGSAVFTGTFTDSGKVSGTFRYADSTKDNGTFEGARQ